MIKINTTYVHIEDKSSFFFFSFNVAHPKTYKKVGEQVYPEKFRELVTLILDSPYLHLPRLVVHQENRKVEPSQSKN